MVEIEWDWFFTRFQQQFSLQSQIPSLNQLTLNKVSPYQILISTILSLRTRDDVTLRTSLKLFEVADTPQAMVALDVSTIAQLIYPSGFYKTKAQQIIRISEILLSQYQGQVPQTREQLLALPGVGHKTANLVLNLAFQINAICVDTHVHRICNRLGFVETKSAEATEIELEKILPPSYWIPINSWLVSFGQHICTPMSPHCKSCPTKDRCPQRGVKSTRI